MKPHRFTAKKHNSILYLEKSENFFNKLKMVLGGIVVAEGSEQLVLLYDPDRCTGCRYCEIACSYKHYGVLSFEKARRHVVFDLEHIVFEAVQCMHCDDPVCASVCPEEAVKKDEKTGWVLINPMKCIGCRSCVVSCPMGAPQFDESLKVAVKCDFCDGDPWCAKYCSPQAIQVLPREEALEIMKKMYEVGA